MNDKKFRFAQRCFASLSRQFAPLNPPLIRQARKVTSESFFRFLVIFIFLLHTVFSFCFGALPSGRAIRWHSLFSA